MGCSSCGNSTGGCNCSSSSNCGCGGDCGQPTKIITKQGLTGPPGPAGDPAAYYFRISQPIDFLDTYIPVANSNSNHLGTITINASANGVGKSYFTGTPVRLKPYSHLGSPGSFLFPVPEISGIVLSYNVLTGELTMYVLSIQGTGTYTDWSVDLSYSNPNRITYLKGIEPPPSGVGSNPGGITIPANTIFRQYQTVKINIAGICGPGSGDGIVYFDGVELFRKAFTVTEEFNLDITLNVGYNITLLAELRTNSGTNNHFQSLGINDPSYLFSTYAPKFKTDLVLDFELYPSQPFGIWSGVAYRL